jgi:hypothetical protein
MTGLARPDQGRHDLHHCWRFGEFNVRLIVILMSLLATATSAAFAQQPLPKREIAPEYREAAENRALEKQKLAMCQAKTDSAKVLIRNRAKTIIDCLDAK